MKQLLRSRQIGLIGLTGFTGLTGLTGLTGCGGDHDFGDSRVDVEPVTCSAKPNSCA